MSRKSRLRDARFYGCLVRSIHVWLAICDQYRPGTRVNDKSLKSAKCFGLNASPYFKGIPNRMDRFKSLGNAVPPRMAEVIARAILHVEEHMRF